MGHVQLYGERGGGGAVRDGPQENFDEGQVCRQKRSGLKRLAEMRRPFASPVDASVFILVMVRHI